MPRSAPLALALALTGAACDAPTVPGEAPAYEPTVLTGGRVYHWPLGRTVAIHVAAASPGETASLRADVLAGAAAWRRALRYDELAVRLVDRPEEADVVVAFAGAGHPVTLDACGGFGVGSTFTLLCPAGDSARTLPLRSGISGRVKIAVAIDPDAASSPAVRAALVAHELGHAFGVGGHSPQADDLMHAEPRVATPSARDGQTLRYVVHRPAALRL
jgi:predicted Zn-dependent protease